MKTLLGNLLQPATPSRCDVTRDCIVRIGDDGNIVSAGQGLERIAGDEAFGDPDCWILPGFVDAHVHLAATGLALNSLDLTGTTTIADALARIRAAALRTPETFAVGKGGQALVVLGPEHAGFCIAQGWSQDDVSEFLARESRITPDELEAAGVHLETGAQHDMTPGEDGKLPAVASADDITQAAEKLAKDGGAAIQRSPEWSEEEKAKITAFLQLPRA